MSTSRATAPKAILASVVVLIWSAHRARTHEVSAREERLFRRFNGASDKIHGKVWTLMQYGSFSAVAPIAVLVGMRRGRRTGAVVGAAGTAAWLLGKVLKRIVGRGRPADHLRLVNVRGQPQSGRGYPSGHAAVSLSLALASTSTSWARIVAVAFSSVAAGGRVYVGAHLPLDIAGGLAIGVIVGVFADRLRS